MVHGYLGVERKVCLSKYIDFKCSILFLREMVGEKF